MDVVPTWSNRPLANLILCEGVARASSTTSIQTIYTQKIRCAHKYIQSVNYGPAGWCNLWLGPQPNNPIVPKTTTLLLYIMYHTWCRISGSGDYTHDLLYFRNFPGVASKPRLFGYFVHSSYRRLTGVQHAKKRCLTSRWREVTQRTRKRPRSAGLAHWACIRYPRSS